MSLTALELAQQLKAKFPGLLSEPVEFRGELSLDISDIAQMREICAFAKKDLSFDFLVDITGIDNYGEDPRFTLVYHLYGLAHQRYLRLKAKVSEESAEAPSVISVWRSADWHEREVYDMFGIKFRDHPDLRRILMWEGYPYYPLRKDFPLAGRPTELPEVAFTKPAPLAGGPFVTVAGGENATSREPRSRTIETDSMDAAAGKSSKNAGVEGEAPARGPVAPGGQTK